MIHWVGRKSASFGFVLGQWEGAGPDILAGLGPYIEFDSQVREWPGTVLHRGTVRLVRVRSNPSSIEVLLKHSRGLMDWLPPKMPEDLHFLRDNGSVILATITHERDFWMSLCTAEADELLHVFDGDACADYLSEIGNPPV